MGEMPHWPYKTQVHSNRLQAVQYMDSYGPMNINMAVQYESGLGKIINNVQMILLSSIQSDDITILFVYSKFKSSEDVMN